MEQVTIWYFTDNDHGIKLSESIKALGLSINTIKGFNLVEANIEENDINLIITDIDQTTPDSILKTFEKDIKSQSALKLILLPKKDINASVKISYNLLHLEFISKPVDKREFLLLLEKSIIVERYREIMRYVSLESENRIETYEGLISINRKNVFETEKEKESFEKIIIYEKNLMREQTRLNKAIKEFTLLRQSEYFDLQNRIKAEEMLSALRRKELMEAKEIIDAQESLIDYSAHEADDCRKIINAVENVAELSRSEAIELHKKLEDYVTLNKKLSSENEKLKKEIEKIKKQ
jgi:hypothetical protein